MFPLIIDEANVEFVALKKKLPEPSVRRRKYTFNVKFPALNLV